MGTEYLLEDEFGDIIQKARLGLGYDIPKLAELTGISSSQLVGMEKYEIDPTSSQVQQLAATLQLEPNKLQAIADKIWSGITPEPVKGWEVIELSGNKGQANCYIVARPNIKFCVIIDPGVDYTRIKAAIQSRSVAAVLITHYHHDHINSLNQLLADEKCPVYVGQSENVPDFHNYNLVTGGRLSLLETSVEVLNTPGHTQGSICYIFDQFAFVGDLIFAGSVGRALPGGHWYHTHINSVRRVLDLPPATILFSGHGPKTTVSNELNYNPFC